MTVTTRTAAWLLMALSAADVWADCVLLHNGSLLEGRLDWGGDSLTLHQPGGAIRLRKSDVRHTADSALAIYEFLRADSIAGEPAAETHLALADWALVNSLWPQAARELLDARRLDPRSRRLDLLEHRLDELTRPRADSALKTQPLNGDAREPVERFASNNSIASAAPRMPAGSLEHFTRRVQPIVLNGCGVAGCHRGGAGDPFPLDVGRLHGRGSARATQQNLETVLGAIDLGSPGRSPLLAAARGPHAGQKPLSGPRRAELLARLEAWVRGVGALNAAEIPPPPQNLAERPIAMIEPQPTQPTPPRIDPAVQPATFEALPSVPAQRGVRLRRLEPRDEFDAAIFNDRFRRPEDDLPLSEGSAARP